MSTQPPLFIYIPMDRRQALACSETLADRCSGAALFADISGFTSLTEALAKDLGRKRGAEELTKYLNVIYTGLIDEVHRFRGSVIGFAGDAITCWFDDAAPRAIERAVACAMQLQAVMQRLGNVTTPGGQVITVAIKVAVTSGPARRFIVGDPAIMQIDTLAGDTLVRLAEVEHTANRGEVVVDAHIADALAGALRVREWRESHDTQRSVAVVDSLTHAVQPNTWPELPQHALTDDVIRPWLLPGIYERERNSTEAFQAELRPAVALFIRFDGIDYANDPVAHTKLDELIRHVQATTTKYEGVLLQLTIGDKGSYGYIAFGAPIAHDDDAMCAVATALELRAQLTNLPYVSAVQFGISMGTMRVGPYGGAAHRTFGVLGDEVNMAARLMTSAKPGQIFISPQVAAEVNKRYDLRSVGDFAMKGKSQPVHVSQVIQAKEASTRLGFVVYPYPLVGRDEEFARMVTLLDEAQAGRGQVLRLIGPAGVGKSHLTNNFAVYAIGNGWNVSLGACQSTLRDVAYTPWRQIFRTLLGVSPDTTAEHIEAFLQQRNDTWLVRAPLLGDLLGIAIPDNATTEAFDPKLRQSALFDLASEILETLAKELPQLIVLDEVHWIDEVSAGLATAIVRAMTAAPIFVLMTQRPLAKDGDVLMALDSLPHHHTLLLGELSARGTQQLVEARVGDKTATLALALIHSVAQGNPFYTEELVDTLREVGNLIEHERNSEWQLSEAMFTRLQQADSIVRVDGTWQLRPNASLSGLDLGLPDSVQGAVLSRIDRLPEAAKLTLKVASVIGRVFSLDVLAAAHPREHEPSVIGQQLALLESRDFARTEAQGEQTHTTYVFKHNVTRDAAYDTLLHEQRLQLHGAVAEALERIEPDAISPIAYHAFIGERWDKALRFQLEAGEQARKLFANHEGIEHLRKALKSAQALSDTDTSYERLSIHMTLGELLTTTAQYDPAFANLHNALALAEAQADVDAQARTCRWMAYAHEFRSEFADALSWIERGLGVLGERETPFTAELYAIAGLVANRMGNSERAEVLCDKSIRIAEHLKMDGVLAFASSSRALVSYAQGRTHDAVQFYQQAAHLYEGVNNVQGQAMSLNGIGTTFQEMGRWDEAVSYLSRAREIFVATGDELHQAFADNNVGEILRQQGKLDQALQHYSSALTSLQKLGGSKYVLAVLNMNLGATCVRQGSVKEAFSYLSTSEQLFEASQAKDFLPELLGYKAEAMLADGNYAGAMETGQAALHLARELKMQTEEGKSLRILGEISAAANEITLARNFLNDAIEMLSTVGNAYPLARAQLAAAKFYLQQRDVHECERLLAACVPTFERLNAQLDLEATEKLHTLLTNR